MVMCSGYIPFRLPSGRPNPSEAAPSTQGTPDRNPNSWHERGRPDHRYTDRGKKLIAIKTKMKKIGRCRQGR